MPDYEQVYLSPEDMRETLIEDWSSEPLEWGKLFFPHHFRLETPKFHLDMLSAAMTARLLAVAAPRESAKSTILVFILPLHAVLFKRRRFILIVSNTFKKASMHLDSIKKELVENEKLKSIFQGITLERDAEGDTIFKHPDGFKTLILCKGVDQIGSVRGVKFGAYRPDLVIGDDMEDDELVKNPQRRTELQNEYDEALVPAGEKGKCQYVMVGTILHDDGLLAKLTGKDHYPEYKKLFFEALIDNERSLWPEKWSVEYLKQLEKEKPNVFAKEYQNNPVAGTNTRFQKADFRTWKQEGLRSVLMGPENSLDGTYLLSDCKAAISCDLAWKEKRDSDASVIMPGFLTPNSEILVETYVSKKGMRPDETAEHLFMMVERLEKLTGSSVPVGFEKSMLENVTQWLLRREMKARNKFLITKELLWDHDKNTRIETRLQPRYAQHVIFHKTGMGDLEYQLERFPFGTHDDLVDALQGLVQLLQFPKEAAKEENPEDEFNWWRKQAIEMRKPKKLFPKTGEKHRMRWQTIPAKIAWR